MHGTVELYNAVSFNFRTLVGIVCSNLFTNQATSLGDLAGEIF